jgi:hypothetical protein
LPSKPRPLDPYLIEVLNLLVRAFAVISSNHSNSLVHIVADP